MSATVIHDRLGYLHDVKLDLLDNNCVLVWIASTETWVPRPYNDGSGDSNSMTIGNQVVGGHPSHVLCVDAAGKLSQAGSIPQDFIDGLVSDLKAKAPKISPYLQGEPKAAVPDLKDDSLRVATTGWVRAQEFERFDQKGQPFGYASLDATGKIPTEQLPTSIVEGLPSAPGPQLSTDVVGSLPTPRRGGRERSVASVNPGLIRFSVAVKDTYAPKDSLFKGSDHGNKLCYKDEHGYVHELYS